MKESTDLIIQILSTTVIATIITGLFSLFKSKKDARLNYIVEERKRWRDSLREIVKKLNEIEHSQPSLNISDADKLELIKQNVAEFECRINPIGLLNKNDIEREGHIWDKINSIYDYSSFEKLKNSGDIKVLRRYISTLLKYDWERSKEEINGNALFTLSKVVQLISILVYIITAYFMIKGNLLSNNILIVSILIVDFIGLLILISFSYDFINKNNNALYIILVHILVALTSMFSLVYIFEGLKFGYYIIIILLYTLQIAPSIITAFLFFRKVKQSYITYNGLVQNISTIPESNENYSIKIRNSIAQKNH